jgi:hypothetical protein
VALVDAITVVRARNGEGAYQQHLPQIGHRDPFHYYRSLTEPQLALVLGKGYDREVKDGSAGGLHHAVMRLQHGETLRRVRSELGIYGKARLTALLCPAARILLQIVPREAMVTSHAPSSADFAVLLRMRLGVVLGVGHAGKRRCGGCFAEFMLNEQESCDVYLGHVICCTKFSGNSRFHVHNTMVGILVRFLKEAGYVVGTEQPVNNGVDRRRTDFSGQDDNGGIFYSDFTAVSCLAASVVAASGKDPLRSTSVAEKNKCLKYADVPDPAQNIEFIPFAVDMFGTFGEGAMRILTAINKHYVDLVQRGDSEAGKAMIHLFEWRLTDTVVLGFHAAVAQHFRQRTAFYRGHGVAGVGAPKAGRAGASKAGHAA